MLGNPGCKLVPQRRQRLLAAAAAQPAQGTCQAPLLQARHSHALPDARPDLWQGEALTHLYVAAGGIPVSQMP